MGSLLTKLPAGICVEEPRKSSLLDNDDLAKALAELSEDSDPGETDIAEDENDADAEISPAVSVENTETRILKEAPAEEKSLESIPKKKAADLQGERGKYSMVRHLSEADVQIAEMQGEEKVTGVWSKEAFVFPGAEKTSIRAEKVNFSYGSKSAISVILSPKQIYRISFNAVPPFSKISLQYKLQGTENSTTLNYMYFKVYVGQYELRRIQVSSMDDWLTIALNVGAVSFLNQSLPVSFEFSTNQASGLKFSFIPETE